MRCADVVRGPAANWGVGIVIFERINQRVRQARGSRLRDQAILLIPEEPGICRVSVSDYQRPASHHLERQIGRMPGHHHR